jgi:hypothetical protein
MPYSPNIWQSPIIRGQSHQDADIVQQLHMRTPNGTPKGSRELRSLPVAMVQMYLINELLI